MPVDILESCVFVLCMYVCMYVCISNLFFVWMYACIYLSAQGGAKKRGKRGKLAKRWQVKGPYACVLRAKESGGLKFLNRYHLEN